MSGLPGFLRGAARAPIQDAAAGPIRAGSLALAIQGAPWRVTLLHDRSAAMLVWITRGQGRAIIGGVRRGVSIHSALFLPPGTLWALDLQAGAQALHVEAPPRDGVRLPAEPLHLRVRDGRAQSELTGLIDALTREAREGQPRSAQAQDAYLQLIGVWLHRQVAAGCVDAPPGGAGLRLVRRFAGAVVRDYRLPRPMADYAAALDVTPTHLTRACRAACGHTAAEILTQRKLHAARSALEHPHPPVKQIASDLGFGTPAYFSRFVHAQTGRSPTALRRAARKPGPPG